MGHPPFLKVSRSLMSLNFKNLVPQYAHEEPSKIKLNQVNEFVDHLIGLDNPSQCKHILLLYEEIEAARRIEMRYIKNQLNLGQTCACLVHSENLETDETMLRSEMAYNGVDVDAVEKRDQLRIIPITETIIEKYKLRNLNTSDEIVRAYQEISTQGKRPPSAGIGKTASDEELTKPERQALRLEVEQIANQMCQQGDFTWICSYPVENVMKSLDKEWIQALVLHHDAVIYVPINSNGLVLKLV
jgi:hypothetical protein